MRPNLGAYAIVNNGVFQAPQMYTPNLDKVSFFNFMNKVHIHVRRIYVFLFCSIFWDTFPFLSWPRRGWCLSQPLFKMPSATPAEHPSWQVGGGWGLFWTFMPSTSLLEHLFWMALLAQAFDPRTLYLRPDTTHVNNLVTYFRYLRCPRWKVKNVHTDLFIEFVSEVAVAVLQGEQLQEHQCWQDLP